MTFRKSSWPFIMIFMLIGAPLWADKIIMKDGKIFTGRIMGETSRSMLIRPAIPDGKPFFVDLHEVQTVIHDPQAPESESAEAHRFAQVSMLVTGTHVASSTLGFGWAPGINLEGGFRIHPAIELGAGLDFYPTLSGLTAVEDTQSQTIRQYQSFYAYSGGFYAKAFPFFKKSFGRFEPFLMGGYGWTRVTPKDSGDYFSGTLWRLGPGVYWHWTGAFTLEMRCLYEHASFDTVKFGSSTGAISGVHQNNVSLGLGVAYRFL